MDHHRTPYRGSQWGAPSYSKPIYSPPPVYKSPGLYSPGMPGMSSVPIGVSYSSRSLAARELPSSPSPRRRRLDVDVSSKRRADDSSESSSSASAYTPGLAYRRGRPPTTSTSNAVSTTIAPTSSKLSRRIDNFLKSSEETIDRVTRRRGSSSSSRKGGDSPSELSLSLSGRVFHSTSAASIAVKAGKHLNNMAETKGAGIAAAGGSTSDSLDNLDSDSDEGLNEISDDTSADLSKLEDLSSDSDDEFFDVVPLGNRNIPLQPAVTPMTASNNKQLHQPTINTTPNHSQSVPAVNKLKNMVGGGVTTSAATSTASKPAATATSAATPTSAVTSSAAGKPANSVAVPERAVTPSPSLKKYPAPQPPGSISRQASSASIARTAHAVDPTLSGLALSRQLSSASIARNSLLLPSDDSSRPGTPGPGGNKCQRSPSFKKYPAPQPPGVSRQNSMASIASYAAGEKRPAPAPPTAALGSNIEKSSSATNPNENTKAMLTNGVSSDTKATTAVGSRLTVTADAKKSGSETSKTENASVNGSVDTHKKSPVANGKLSNGHIEDVLSAFKRGASESLHVLKNGTPEMKEEKYGKSLSNGTTKSSTSANLTSSMNGKRSTSRDVSADSNNPDDDRSRRSSSRDPSSKKSFTGKLAAMANKFESDSSSKSENQKPLKKSQTESKVKKFVPKATSKNKFGSLASKFEANDSSADPKSPAIIGKLQSPYSKPFDPEPIVQPVVSRKSIGGINISKFGGTGKFPTQSQLRKNSRAESNENESPPEIKDTKSSRSEDEQVPDAAHSSSLTENLSKSKEKTTNNNPITSKVELTNSIATPKEKDLPGPSVTPSAKEENSSEPVLSSDCALAAPPATPNTAPSTAAPFAIPTTGQTTADLPTAAPPNDAPTVDLLTAPAATPPISAVSSPSVNEKSSLESKEVVHPITTVQSEMSVKETVASESSIPSSTLVTSVVISNSSKTDLSTCSVESMSPSAAASSTPAIISEPSIETTVPSVPSTAVTAATTVATDSNASQDWKANDEIPIIAPVFSSTSMLDAISNANTNHSTELPRSEIVSPEASSTDKEDSIGSVPNGTDISTSLSKHTIPPLPMPQAVGGASELVASEADETLAAKLILTPTLPKPGDSPLLTVTAMPDTSESSRYALVAPTSSPTTPTVAMELGANGPTSDSSYNETSKLEFRPLLSELSSPGYSTPSLQLDKPDFARYRSTSPRPSSPRTDLNSSPYLRASVLTTSMNSPSSIFTRASSVAPSTSNTSYLSGLNVPYMDDVHRARSLTPMDGISDRRSVRPKSRFLNPESRAGAVTSSALELDKPESALEKYRRRKQMRNSATRSKLDALTNQTKDNAMGDTTFSKDNLIVDPMEVMAKSSTDAGMATEGSRFKIDLSSIKDFLKKTEEEISKLPRYIREPWSMGGILGSSSRTSDVSGVSGEPVSPSALDTLAARGSSPEGATSLDRLSCPAADDNSRKSSLESLQRPRSSDGDEEVYVDAREGAYNMAQKALTPLPDVSYSLTPLPDTSQMDTLMPLPDSKDLERRCRSVTPSRVLENTEKVLSQTDRILKNSRSGKSLRKSYSRSMSAANIERLAEVVADLAEEHSTAQLAGERLEAEQADRMRLEKELDGAQGDMRDLTLATERLEREKSILRSEMLQQASCLNNGDLTEGDDASSASLFKRKFEWSQREVESLKQQLRQHQQDEYEQTALLKKQLEKKVADAREETEEQRQVAGQLKKRTQRLQAEMNDLKILLEEQAARNSLLEKKQRKFDSDLSAGQDELRVERLNKEKVMRERDAHLAEKYAVDQELATLKLELELKDERVTALTRQLDELSGSSQGELELTQLRKAKHDLESKVKDQEEELDELAGQVQMLEAARTRLEMSCEQMRKENRKEVQQREEEVEEVRIGAQKKVKALEAQVETEHEERTQLVREKHELERRLLELQDRSSVAPDDDTVQRLKKDLRKTKALLKDTQMALEKSQCEGPSKLIIRQLKTQLEDTEFAKTAALKARQSADADLSEVQSALEDAQRARKEAEERASRLLKEKTELQTQLEEGEELHVETLKKYKSTVSQISVDQITLSDQSQRIAELEQEKQLLSDRLLELSSKVEVLEGETANIHTQRMLQMKVKELESKLELEYATRKRIESQLGRLKEQIERLSGECDLAKLREAQSNDQAKKLSRQLRQTKEETAMLQQRNTELSSKKQELEKQMELMDSEISTGKSDLKLAFKRIEDLQMALQGDISDSDSDLSDSESDSDTSLTKYLASSSTVRASRSTSSTAAASNTAAAGASNAASPQPNRTAASPTDRADDDDLLSPGSDAMAIIQEAKEELQQHHSESFA